MPYLNRYEFIGNLTKAPELRLRPADGKQALCLLNVAINRDTRDEAGEKRTRTTYINDIEVWGPPGEACAHFLTTGSLVFVEGRMDIDRWQDRKSGAPRQRMKVVAEYVQFLRIRRAAADAAPEAAQAPTARRPSRRPARAAQENP